VEAARIARVVPVRCPSDAFEDLVALGDRLVYVVTRARELIVAPELTNGFEICHSVLASGEPVLAAGSLDVIWAGDYKAVLTLTHQRGHYRPDPSCLVVVAEVLSGLGFDVPAEVVEAREGGGG
jgi:hypothetical protein